MRQGLFGATLLSSAMAVSLAQAQEARPTAGELVAAIASGAETAEGVMEDTIAAIQVRPELNAIANMNVSVAMDAAKAVDAGEITGPLAGLPIVVKDNIQVEGLSTAAGTPALQDAVAEANAPVLQKLVDAGAIVVATTNMHELAFGISGYNPTYQTGKEPGVRNPYDTARFAGGSSSGTGAIIGAGAVRAGFGTDTGGSVRVPAAINGVSGLRPTMGRYSAEAIVPISHTRDTPGVIAASVADIELLDRVIAGGDEVQPADLSGVTLGLGSGFTAGLDADVQAVWDGVVARLEEAGITMVEVDDAAIMEGNGKISFPIALTEARADLEEYLAAYAPDISIDDVVAQIASEDVKGTYEAMVMPGQLPGPDGMVDGAPIYESAMTEGRPALIAAYDKLFADSGIDALLFPTVPQVAALAEPASSSPEMFGAIIRNTDPGSNAGLPGLSIAAGLGAETGLPVGIELDGPAGSDRELIAIGMAIEDLLGRTPPPAN
jgi:indoleacetamide hydrolase